MSNTNAIFFGYDYQLTNELIKTIVNYFTKQEKIHFSQKTIKFLSDEEDMNNDIKEDIVVYESEEPRPLKLIDITNQIPESKHKIFENYNNNKENNIFICVFSTEYLLTEQDEISLKKIYLLFEKISLNIFFCIINRSQLTDNEDNEELELSANYFRKKLGFLFKNQQNSFDVPKYNTRVFFVKLSRAFEICQKEENSLLEELKESRFSNFLTELKSSWEQIRQKENREAQTNQSPKKERRKNMNYLLEPGQTVHIESSQTLCTIEQFLGGGGQGEVYRANLGDQPVALKWYFPHSIHADPGQRERLEEAIKLGSPNERFLWPMDIVSETGIEGFGYVMPLREPQYKGFVDLMKRGIKPEPTFKTLATAGFQLADSFFQLHIKGLCYRDISFGNVFFNPNTGEILICDNDNVTINGDQKGGVMGTPRFMAPEIITKQARPSTQTDLYSLAVLLFYMLMIHHPLEGKKETEIKCLDLPAMNKLYGTEAVFIFDPKDKSNEPVPGYHDNALTFWTIYPQFLRELFTKAFTNGIQDPENGRIRESEWRGAMVRLRDSIVYCPHCSAENFYDLDVLKASSGKLNVCWSCQKEIRLPPRSRSDKNTIMLNYDTKLFPHHTNTKSFDFSKPIAEVTQHPTDPNIWGLKNLSEEKWVCTTADNQVKDVEPGRSLTIAVGTKINFGKAEGEVRS